MLTHRTCPHSPLRSLDTQGDTWVPRARRGAHAASARAFRAVPFRVTAPGKEGPRGRASSESDSVYSPRPAELKSNMDAG